MPTVDEAIARHRRLVEAMNKQTDEVVSKTPNSVSTGDLFDYLKGVTVVCAGRLMKVESIRCVDVEDGSVWNPINMNNWRVWENSLGERPFPDCVIDMQRRWKGPESKSDSFLLIPSSFQENIYESRSKLSAKGKVPKIPAPHFRCSSGWEYQHSTCGPSYTTIDSFDGITIWYHIDVVDTYIRKERNI